jgi:hypothetical protein
MVVLLMTKKLNGVEVANASRSLRIDITSNDVKKGKPLNPHECAAAQCILRSTNAKDVAVHRGVCYLLINKKWVRYKTPSSLRLETIIFDRGGTFMPGEYDLAPVPVSMIARPKKTNNGTKGLKLRQATMRRRRMTIPGVRRSARSTDETDET